MKSYKEITYRYLKGQRNRTLLTILGIILSVALISAIGTIIVSVRGAMIEEEIKENGSFHGKFVDIDKDNINKLINHVEVSEIGVSKFEGSAAIKETTKEERREYGIDIPYRYIEIEGYEDKALKMLPFVLREGRFPENSDEIAIEYWMTNYFDREVKLGNKIKLNIGNRIVIDSENNEEEKKFIKETFEKIGEKEYTVVGFIKPQYIWTANLVTKGITGLGDTLDEGKYNAYIKVPKIKDANEKIMSIAEDVGISKENVQYNNKVLRLYAESLSDTFNKALVALLVFVVTLIIVSTIAVIYNAFNISVLERISQFGLLRSVGSTPNQIRGIVLKEATILSIIGIPIGLFSGVFAMRVVLYIISLFKSDIYLFKSMKISISWVVLLISFITGLITVFLSAIGPARRAGKVSPLEAVRNTGNFKKENFKKVKSSTLIRKILGVEGEIAYKNLRRNRKRFIITVFSMVISISLFITFSSFSDFLFKMGVIENGDTGEFMIFGEQDFDMEKVYEDLKNIKDVQRVYKLNHIYGGALIVEDKISKKLIEMSPSLFEHKKDGLTMIENVQVTTIGDENFEVLKGLLKEGTLDINRLNRENGVLVINNTYAHNQKTDRQSLVEGYKLKVGDKIKFSHYGLDQEGVEKKYKELTVVGVLEKGILDIVYNQNGSINIITTEEVLNNLLQVDNKEITRRANMDIIIEMAKDGNTQEVKSYLEEMKETVPGFNYIDYAEAAKESRIASIIVSIFLYGFVTIIALISSINIINTISTNILLRTKEIAMIKAVGMSQTGIKKMVALESLFYGIYAAIFGGPVGVGLAYILFNIVMNIREFQWTMPWKNIAIACIGVTIIALLSGVYPLKRINDKIIVESMKSEN